MICTICGGTGGARLAHGLNSVSDPGSLTYICNIGDNIRLYGLTVCPDIDTLIYYLSGVADYERGWGLHAESFNFLERVRLFYPGTWFGLGDKDLATHVWRSALLREGWSLSEVTVNGFESPRLSKRGMKNRSLFGAGVESISTFDSLCENIFVKTERL